MRVQCWVCAKRLKDASNGYACEPCRKVLDNIAEVHAMEGQGERAHVILPPGEMEKRKGRLEEISARVQREYFDKQKRGA